MAVEPARAPATTRWDPPLPAPVVDLIRQQLAATEAPVTPSSMATVLRQQRAALGSDSVLHAMNHLGSEFAGFGVLQPLVRDPAVTDVLVNGPRQVYVDRGAGLVAADVRFTDSEAVRRLAQRLATAAGRRLDDAAPWVDARLPGGVRLHAVVPPVSTDCTLVSLRIPRTEAFTIEDFLRCGSLTSAMADLLRDIVRARLAFLVTGGTGTGKTTLLTTLLGMVPTAHRLVLVEDTGELRPDHPHVVRLEARPPNVEGAGGIALRSLVRQALRMRPDRLVVGEVRGAEVVDLLAALNTGHEGGCGTIHANSAADVPARVEALGAMAGLPAQATTTQLASAVDVVIGMYRSPSGLRQVGEICVLVADPSGRPRPQVAWNAEGPGPGLDDLRRRLVLAGLP